MSVTTMSPVEGHSMTRQNPPHHICDRNLPCPQKKMTVIAQQRPCIAGSRAFQQDAANAIEKGLAIFIVSEDNRSLDSSNDYVMERPWGIYSRLTWHCSFLPSVLLNVNISTTSPCLFPVDVASGRAQICKNSHSSLSNL